MHTQGIVKLQLQFFCAKYLIDSITCDCIEILMCLHQLSSSKLCTQKCNSLWGRWFDLRILDTHTRYSFLSQWYISRLQHLVPWIRLWWHTCCNQSNLYTQYNDQWYYYWKYNKRLHLWHNCIWIYCKGTRKEEWQNFRWNSLLWWVQLLYQWNVWITYVPIAKKW